MFDGREIPVFAASFTVVAAMFFMRRFKQNGIKDDGKRYPPSLPVLPVYGSILRGGMSDLPGHFMRSAETHGPVYFCRLGTRMVVVLNGYDAIYDAFVRHSEAFADREDLFTERKILNPELRGLAYSHYDDAFKKYHKLCPSILKEFGFGVQRVSEPRILQEVESMNNKILKQNGRPFDPKWLLAFSTSNLTMSILFGKNFLQSSPKDHADIVKGSAAIVENMEMALNMAPFVRFLPKFRKNIEIMRAAKVRMFRGLEAGIKFIKANASEPTFVGRFMEIEGTNYDHQDLLYILRNLCFAGINTVAITIQWAVVELANHPEVQNRLQKEIDEMIPRNRLPSLDDKPRMPYTEAVILEIMRLHTILSFYVPHKTLKDTKVLGYDVPKGCMIFPNGYSAHMDPKFWKDPQNFRPERFLDSDNNIIDSHRVIAFGLGKRSCMGVILARESTFLFLTSLVQRFDIQPPEGQKTINVKEQIAVLTVPTQYEVRLIPRVKPTQKQG